MLDSNSQRASFVDARVPISRARRFAAISLLVAMSFGVAVNSHGAGATTSPTDVAEEKTMQNAKALRHDIDVRYQQLKDSGRLVTNGNGRNMITDVLAKYIKPGMRWDSAKRLLEGAGFTVFRIGEHMMYPRGSYAVIDFYERLLLGKVSISAVVQLNVGPSESESTVESVEADIVVSIL
jgi:hypothetical protein